MKAIIPKLFSEGDSYLMEAKSMFFLRKEEQHCGSCNSCNAIKKYLDAYKQHLFKGSHSTENYHLLLHSLIEGDPEFKKFTEKIYEVKCFAEESKREGEHFFLYAEEINDVLNIAFEIRKYISKKVGFKKEFLADYLHTSYMTT